jgi:hypothetical protein
MGQVVEELATLHENVVPKAGEPARKKKIRFHLFESTKAPKPKSAASTASKMELREAIAKLSGQDFAPRKQSLLQKVALLERLIRSPTSIYAAKTAAAVSVYAVFLLAPSLKVWSLSSPVSGVETDLVPSLVLSSPSSPFSFLACSAILHRLRPYWRNHHSRRSHGAHSRYAFVVSPQSSLL